MKGDNQGTNVSLGGCEWGQEELSAQDEMIDEVLDEGMVCTVGEVELANEVAQAENTPEALSDVVKENTGLLPSRRDRWVACGFQDAMKGSQGKPPWIIEDLLLAESATLVSAQPHAMKSLSLLSACLEAVYKKTVWGHFAAPNVDSVLFLETEDPAWMVEARIRGLAKGLGIKEDDPLSGFHYACVGPFDFLGTRIGLKS